MTGKKAAVKGAAPTFHEQHAHLFTKKAKKFSIGGDIRRIKDLSRYVRWPKYIRVQRQKHILLQRLKTPPSINHFNSKALNAQQAAPLLAVLKKYSPETKKEKKVRLTNKAKLLAEGKSDDSPKPFLLKFGLNHVTSLIEKQKAAVVVIANDVDPIELVAWLPALCRATKTPYVIVKDKSILGQLVHMKTASVVALTDVRKEDQNTLDQFLRNFNPQFKDLAPQELRRWGARVLGAKANAKIEKLRKAKAREQGLALK
jgi:large subunit ribosomal protein L7Ae